MGIRKTKKGNPKVSNFFEKIHSLRTPTPYMSHEKKMANKYNVTWTVRCGYNHS